MSTPSHPALSEQEVRLLRVRLLFQRFVRRLPPADQVNPFVIWADKMIARLGESIDQTNHALDALERDLADVLDEPVVDPLVEYNTSACGRPSIN